MTVNRGGAIDNAVQASRRRLREADWMKLAIAVYRRDRRCRHSEAAQFTRAACRTAIVSGPPNRKTSDTKEIADDPDTDDAPASREQWRAQELEKLLLLERVAFDRRRIVLGFASEIRSASRAYELPIRNVQNVLRPVL
jgi:hypothetical protein